MHLKRFAEGIIVTIKLEVNISWRLEFIFVKKSEAKSKTLSIMI